MKLHLPKILVLTLLSSTVAVAADLKYDSSSPASTYDIGLGSDTSTLLNTKKGEAGVTITSGQTVGTYSDGKLVCDAIGSTTTAQTNNLTIQRTVNRSWTNLYSGKETGDLTITGSGQVAIGGKSSDGKSFSQLFADNISINGDGSVVNLKASVVKANTFTLDEGIAEIHTGSSDFSQGSFYLGTATGVTTQATDIYAPKQAQFYKNLNVNGGKLTIGSTNGAYVATKVHYIAGFGASEGYSCAITQSGGMMSVYGDTLAQKNFSITQNGDKEALMHFSDNLALMGDATISQSNDKASLVIGRLTDERNEGGNSANVTVNQSGAGSIQLASGTSFSKASTLSIDQSGTGNIKIGGGIDKEVVGVENIEASRAKFTSTNTTYSISQTGSGTVTIASDAAITASDISIAGTLENNGTINGTEDSLLEIVGGKVENNGTIAMDIYMEDGELTATDGSNFANITAKEGVITISGTVNITGELILGNATMVSTFSANSTEGKVIVNLLDAKSGINLTDIDNLALGKDVVFNVMVDSLDDLKANDTLTIFNIESNETVNITQQVTATDKNGNEKMLSYTNNGDGSVTVNAVVPEPTTATLSLLALAALASRRRRK